MLQKKTFAVSDRESMHAEEFHVMNRNMTNLKKHQCMSNRVKITMGRVYEKELWRVTFQSCYDGPNTKVVIAIQSYNVPLKIVVDERSLYKDTHTFVSYLQDNCFNLFSIS